MAGGGLSALASLSKQMARDFFLSYYKSSHIFISWVRYSPALAASRLLIYIPMCRRCSELVSKIKAECKFTDILQIQRYIETRQSFIHFLNVNQRSGAEGMKFKSNWQN